MKRPITLLLLSLIALSTSAVVQANDIEDFFKAAVRGSTRSNGRDGFRDRRSPYRGRSYDPRSRRSSSFNISIGVTRPRVVVPPVRSYPVTAGSRPVLLPPATVPSLPPAPVPVLPPAPVPQLHNRGPAFPAPPVPVRPVPVNPVPVNPVHPLYVPSATNPHAEFGYGDIVDLSLIHI